MLARLTQNTNGQTTYEVQSGDTFMQIALDNGMTVSEMQQLNPEIDINRIYIGQLLNVREEIPYLSVQTVDSVTYTEAVECPVEQVEDDSMYQGESRVIDPGVPGQALVSANITYVNGREQERDIISTQVLQEATTKVIAVGTKVRALLVPQRLLYLAGLRAHHLLFWLPVHFGSYSYHGGIDIAASYGTGHRRRRRRHRDLRGPGHRQQLELRQPGHHQPRQRQGDLLRPLLQRTGLGGRPRLPGPDHRPGGLHRALHRQPLPL